MRTIRRLYFYAVALISIEIVLWGLINLLRTTLSSGLVFPGADTLAQALALILVGVPIFIIHWLWAQNTSAKDPDEHAATLRAVFLYGVLLGTLIPVIQNILALINRTMVVGAGLSSYRAFVGGSQTWLDNVIAIVLNSIVAVYFFSVLRNDWSGISDRENFAGVRRLYRYAWVLYSLLMAIIGVQQVLHFLFYLPTTVLGEPGRESFINGLALILVGTPIWVYSWNLCQSALAEAGEIRSTLRLGVLYLLSLAGVIVVLSMTGVAVDVLLRRLFGEVISPRDLLAQIGSPISIAIPLSAVWVYYGGWLRKEINSSGDIPRRAGLTRFYLYILSLIGLVATFVGLTLLLSFVIDVSAGNAIWGDVLRGRLCGAIATLLAGLPLWLSAWRPMQAEAFSSDDAGDHARRSLVRRSYLYLVIFAGVIGGMASAIFLIYTLLFGLLDHRTENFVTDILNGLQLITLFGSFLAYHFASLREDGGHSADALAARQARFAVLVFEITGSAFAAPVISAIKNASPAIPAEVHQVEQGITAEMGSVQAVVLPASLALDPPESLRLWLKDYLGHKVIVPVDAKGWYWPGLFQKNGPIAAAQIIRQLAEGQEVRATGGTQAWQLVSYVFAILFGLELLFGLFGLTMSLITG